ncbi:hypothetical protein M8C21_029513, partial [Ambrosia artemisiifolia]
LIGPVINDSPSKEVQLSGSSVKAHKERKLQIAMADIRSEPTKSQEEEAKAPNLIEKGKEEVKKSASHDKETHGTSNDIDEDTPVEKVKGPGILERTKEEIEAVVEAINPKK